MKSRIIFTIFLGIFFISSCNTSKETTDIKLSITAGSDNNAQYRISFINGSGYNFPTFALWSEDMEGNYLRTYFITQSYASGIFGYEMVGDSIWKNQPGPSYQPAALPYWTHKKGLINKKSLIPTPDNPFVDAFTGATPVNNFELLLPEEKDQKFRFLLEVNQAWDWNDYWNNKKFPENNAYRHSAQPSLIYAVTIDPEINEFYLNPIGHGDPKGETGKLFTDLETLTTAKQIFRNIKVERIHHSK